jgi:hypothetical protein
VVIARSMAEAPARPALASRVSTCAAITAPSVATARAQEGSASHPSSATLRAIAASSAST